MVLQHYKLQVSRQTRIFSLLVYSVIWWMMFSSVWPIGYGVVKLIWLIAGLFACLASQQRIRHTIGQFVLLNNGKVNWQGQQWLIKRQPLVLNIGIFFSLRLVNSNQTKTLWLAKDSVSTAEWRGLQQALLRRHQLEPED